MNSDPTVIVIFAALVGASIGFFAACLFASKRIREERRSLWREGYAACNREHDRRRL